MIRSFPAKTAERIRRLDSYRQSHVLAANVFRCRHAGLLDEEAAGVLPIDHWTTSSLLQKAIRRG